MWRAVIALKVMALVYGRCLQEVSRVLLRQYAAEIGGGRGQVDGTFEAILDQEENPSAVVDVGVDEHGRPEVCRVVAEAAPVLTGVFSLKKTGVNAGPCPSQVQDHVEACNASGGTVKFRLHSIKAAARAMSLAVKTQLAV